MLLLFWNGSGGSPPPTGAVAEYYDVDVIMNRTLNFSLVMNKTLAFAPILNKTLNFTYEELQDT